MTPTPKEHGRSSTRRQAAPFRQSPERENSRGRFEPRERSTSTDFRSERKPYHPQEETFSQGKNFSREARAPIEFSTVICAKCQKSCEVPFKPRQGKPVLCRDCFSNQNSSPQRYDNPRPTETPKDDLLQDMNSKLDKIMRALKIH